MTDTPETPEVEETPAAERKVVITKNPDSVVFAAAPFYNLANVRKAALSLITRASSDPAKVDAIKETLEALLAFLEVRAEHAAEVREAEVKAQEAALAAKAKAQAEWAEKDAKNLLKDGKAQVKRAEGILAKLRGK